MLNIAASLSAKFIKNLAQYPFQRVVAYRTCDGIVLIVGYIESRAVEVTAVLGGVVIVPAQSLHVLFRPQDTRDEEFVQWDALYLKTVHKVAGNVLKQDGGTRYKVRDAAVEPLHVIERVAADIYQFALAPLGISPAGDRTHAIFHCCLQLKALRVGETFGIAAHTPDTMLLRCSVGIVESR